MIARWSAVLCVSAFACSARAPVTYQAQEGYREGAELRLSSVLAQTADQTHNAWRDRSVRSRDGLLRVFVEIGRGDSDKREFDIVANSLKVDRVLPSKLGGYPCNYGFIPRTFAYDEDPLDVLILGPRLDPGSEVQGQLLAVLHMEDEKGPDPKVVVSLTDAASNVKERLRQADKTRLAAWFERYKKGRDDGRWAHVTGWGDIEDAERIVEHTAGFFDRVQAQSR